MEPDFFFPFSFQLFVGLSTFEGSSDLLDFLTQLSASMIEKVGESVATLVVAVAAEVGTS